MTDDGTPEALDPAIRWYYDLAPEESRLERGAYRLEFARTCELIERWAPPAPAVVLDVGGAAVAYALWLASRGYEVHLLDAVARLVGLAEERAEAAGVTLASTDIGDARALPFADASADCVLLLGPLYHLTDAADRRQALAEAHRVLRPGGVLFAACITRWASILDGLAHGYLGDPTFAAMADADLRTGQHRNPTDDPAYFTTAYFHTPDELRSELVGSGLEVVGLFGLEGPGGLLGDLDARWGDPTRRAQLLDVARALESEPALLGLSAHLLGVARRRPYPIRE